MDDVEALIAELRSTVTVPARNAYPPPRVRQLGPRAADALTTAQSEAAELRKEVEEMRKALVVLRDLPIIENDNPDTLHLDGVAYTGPAVDFLFRAVRKIKEVAQRAIERVDAPACVGCGLKVPEDCLRMDDAGEFGCEACFTEDGSGDCPNRAALKETQHEG